VYRLLCLKCTVADHAPAWISPLFRGQLRPTDSSS